MTDYIAVNYMFYEVGSRLFYFGLANSAWSGYSRYLERFRSDARTFILIPCMASLSSLFYSPPLSSSKAVVRLYLMISPPRPRRL